MNLPNLKRSAALILALSIPLNLAGCKNETSTEKNIEELTSEEITSFLTSMYEITPVYNLEEIYLSDTEIEAIIDIANNNQECDNQTLDSNEIYNAIITNSLDEFGLITITDDLSEDEKEELDKYIRECLKEAINNMLNKDAISLEDACIMKNLRIIIGQTNSGSCIEYYGKNKVLIIDYLKFKENYNRYESETFRANVTKEGLIRYFELGLNYCRYQVCDCRLEKGQVNTSIGEGNVLDCLIASAFYSGDNSNLGDVNRFIFDNLDLNNNHNTSVLLLLAAFKENRNIDNLYQIVFDGNLQELYKYFGLTSKEDIEKFYKIARTIEILTINNEYQDAFYAETLSTSSTAFRDYVGYGYKVDIFKLCIRDLMKYIANNKDLSKEEAIFLYKFVKQIIINNANINDRDDMFEPNYVNGVISIENIYFDFLSKFYGVSIEEIDELYEDYYSFWCLEEGETRHGIDCNRLINKFPLLQFIATNYRAYSFYIDNFDEQTRK